MSERPGGDPLRIGNGLITGSADPGNRSVTSMDIKQPHGGVHATSKPGDGALDVPSGLQPDIMENHDDEERLGSDDTPGSRAAGS